MIEPAERDEAARLGVFLFVVPRLLLPSRLSSAGLLSALFVVRARGASRSRPRARASTNAAMPITIAMVKRGAPESGAPNTQAGARSSASPITPPSPVGSGQALLGGRHEAKPAAANGADDPQHEPRALAVERAVREQAPAPGGDRKQQRDRRDAEQSASSGRR